jgi:hypothetical protein
MIFLLEVGSNYSAELPAKCLMPFDSLHLPMDSLRLKHSGRKRVPELQSVLAAKPPF